MSFPLESDNTYISYIVKRFVEDHGQEGKDLFFVLKLYIDAYAAAIRSMSNEGE